jgi:Zn-dependent protease with chaperone function
MESSDRDGGQLARGTARVRFPGISPRTYEHPTDKGALTALRSVPGFAAVLKAAAGAFTERGERLAALSSGIRVGPKQYPRLHELRAECAEILDVDPVPEMFVMRDPLLNAMTIGLDRPFVVLNSALVQAVDHESLRVVIGHEIGHVLSGHAVYSTMLVRLINLMNSLSWLPGGNLGLRAIVAALLEWYRKAELSADRAGLLCSQDPMASLRMHMVIAGAHSPDDVDTAEFLRQAADYESEGDIRDSVIKLLNTVNQTHPMAVVRAAELQRWAASHDYRAILTGDYERRGDESATTWAEDVRTAGRAYRDSFVSSTDPLAKFVTGVGGRISESAGRVWERFGGRGDAEQPPT